MSVSILTGRVYSQSLSYGKYNELFNFPILSLGPYTNVYFTSTPVKLQVSITQFRCPSLALYAGFFFGPILLHVCLFGQV